MANDTDYDFVVIGGGTAGFSAATRAVKLGMRTALIEDAPLLGGLCILNGCMPTKTLIETGNRSREARYARWFGIRLPEGEQAVEMRAVRKRKQRLVAEFRDFREKQLNSGDFDLIRGYARFLSPQNIEVTTSAGGCERLYARTTLIATGSYPLLPDIPGLA